MAKLDFWVSVGSTYCYLTVMRIADHCAQAGVDLNWHVFDVREIMVEQNNVPFRDKPIKSAYMWRDLERRAAGYGLPVQVPAPYPLPGLTLANRVAALGLEEGWGIAYIVETYRRWFQQGQPAGEDPNLSGSLQAVGQDPSRIRASAEIEDGKARLDAATDTARRAGIFGAPSFLVGSELFWGDDRLDDAIRWAQHGTLA